MGLTTELKAEVLRLLQDEDVRAALRQAVAEDPREILRAVERSLKHGRFRQVIRESSV